MIFLILIALGSVIPGVYKTEEPLESCAKNEPFRLENGICKNFTKICIREENDQCKSVLNACSQCPPSGYTISMLATLNDKINELSTLRKEIKDIKNVSDSTSERVQLLPTVKDIIKELSTLRKEIKDIKNVSDSTRERVQLLPAIMDKINELSTLRKEIKDIKNMSDSTRERVQLLPAIMDKINELSTLRKEIKDIKNTLNDKTKDISTVREEIKELKNYGICLLVFCIPGFIGILIYQMLNHYGYLPTKIRQRGDSKRQSTDTGSKKKRKPFIDDEPSTPGSINMKNLKDDDIIKSSSVKTAQDLNIRQDIENISSRLDEMNGKLDTQAENIQNIPSEDIKNISSQVNKLIERSDAQAQNSQNVPNEDMKNITTKLDKVIEKLQDQAEKIQNIPSEDMRNISTKLNKLIETLDAQAQNSQNVPNEDMKNISTKLDTIIEKLQDQKAKDKLRDGVPEVVFSSIIQDKDHEN